MSAAEGRGPAAGGRRRGGWRVALRLARRTVRRSRARSALVAVLVALPVLAGAFVAIVARTAQLSPAEQADRELGRRADALVVVTSSPVLDRSSYLSPGGGGSTGDGSPTPRDPAGVDVTALLPAGSRAVPAARERGGQASANGRAVDVSLVDLDLADPLTGGIWQLRAGRVARGPGEVAVTPRLAGRLRVGVGERVGVAGVGTRRVVGVVRDPGSLGRMSVVGPPGWDGSPGAEARAAYDGLGLRYLVDLPGPDSAALHARLRASGVLLLSRADYTRPHDVAPSYGGSGFAAVAAVAAIAGFGLLEIVLLAGTAFAVGARRQIRDLGLLGATGATPRDVRRVMLAQGLWLGSLGAVGAVTLAVLAVVAARPGLERLNGALFGSLDVRPLEVGPIAALGVLSGLAAALVPARAVARLPVTAALNGRFPVSARDARPPRWALATVAAGVAVSALDAWRWQAARRGFQRASEGVVSYGAVPSPPPDLLYVAGLLLGAALLMAGLTGSTAAVVTRLGRLAGRLPLSARLALRDAGRHRHRTAPAVAAVMAALAGTVGALFVVSATDLRDRARYQPSAPAGAVLVALNDPAVPRAGAVLRRVRAKLPPARTVAVRFADQPPPAGRSGAGTPPGMPAPPPEPVFAVVPDGVECGAGCGSGTVGVGGAALVRVVTGRDDPRVPAALAAGKAVVTQPALVSRGRVRLLGGGGEPTPTTLPAVVVPGPGYGDLPAVVVSPATARTQGWRVQPARTYLLLPARPVSPDAEAAAYGAVRRDAYVQVERGYRSGYALGFLALIGASGLVTLLGTSIAVALSLAESRADMATLAAVGAPAYRRRLFAMAQAAAIGWTGALLGLALGTVTAVALLVGDVSLPMSVPGRWLALLVVAVPALGVAVAGLFTRSRLPLVRRAD